MMRIAHVVGGAMNSGGVESFIMNMFEAIDKNHFVFDFVCASEQAGLYDDRIKALGGRIYPICVSSNRVKNIILKDGYKRYLNFFLSHRHFDAVHIHTHNCGRYYIAKAAIDAGIKNIVYHIHAMCGNRLLNFIGRRYLKSKPIKLVACGQAAGRRGYGTAEEILRNAIDLEKYLFNPDVRDRIRREYKIDDNTVVFGNVARLAPQKNQAFLLDIFSRLRIKRKLIFIGDGELRAQLEELVKNNGIEDVIFLGNRSDVNELLNCFDVFVLPSVSEGLPITAIEAQANGLSCIFSENVTREVGIGNTEFIALNQEQWIKSLDCVNIKRKNNLDALRREGYELKREVRHLEEIYKNLGARV
jgi:glycosyltransferase involved in cell wall biosynthesis